MTKADVANLCLAVWRFERQRMVWEQRYSQNKSIPFSVLPAGERGTFDNYIDDYKRAIDNLHLDPAEDRLKKIDLRRSLQSTTMGEICTELQMVCEVTIDELKRHVFMHVPKEKLNVAREPSKFFGASCDAYPSARKDMESACHCYAFGEDTAAVFHSMGVLEAGLRMLATHLKVPFQVPIELQTWGGVLGTIKKEIDTQKAALKGPVDSNKDKLLQFYSDIAIQFDYFKNAWRNHVMHFRRSYDSDEAHTILIHVRDFMLALAERIKETP